MTVALSRNGLTVRCHKLWIWPTVFARFVPILLPTSSFCEQRPARSTTSLSRLSKNGLGAEEFSFLSRTKSSRVFHLRLYLIATTTIWLNETPLSYRQASTKP